MFQQLHIGVRCGRATELRRAVWPYWRGTVLLLLLLLLLVMLLELLSNSVDVLPQLLLIMLPTLLRSAQQRIQQRLSSKTFTETRIGLVCPTHCGSEDRGVD
jgi:hypothetical protein